MKRIAKIFSIICFGYVAVCLILFLVQERLLFITNDLPQDYNFEFVHEYTEHTFYPIDSTAELSAVYFECKDPKGVVLFLHGNTKNIQQWGKLSKFYIDRGYDILFYDYRDYGKSTGKLESENQLISDAQIMYDFLKTRYTESEIIISGTSIGSGIAAQLASRNDPSMLILNAPYFSLHTLIKDKLFFVPEMIIRYKLKTYEVLPNLDCPIEIFHGSEDRLIPIENAEKLSALNKNIHFTVCQGAEHNDFYDKEDFKKRMNFIFK